MKFNTWGLVLAGALICGPSFGQQAEGERPPRPDSTSNAAIGGWCDALTGAKKEECLRDERRRQDDKKGGGTRGDCDRLVGPDKDRCLRQGDTLELDVRSNAGAVAREAAASQ